MFLPSLPEVRHHDPNDQRKKSDVRLGLFLAGFWSFIIAALWAQREGKPLPYGYWLLAVAAMILLYETSFRDQSDLDLRDNG